MRSFLFFIYSFCLLCFQIAEAKTIHAILVVDTVNNISYMTKTDLKNIQEELRVVAKYTHSILKEKIFSGSNFRKDQFISYLNGLSFDPSDMVVFYFSGHGYRTRQKASPLPDLAFELYKPGVDLQWVARTIWGKKPKFALVFADCCNNYIEKGFQNASKNVLINLHKQPIDAEGYRRLFLQAKGCVVVSSSSAGEFSYGSYCGGLFTLCFLCSLNKELSEPYPSWKHLLEQARAYIARIQTPFCEVYH